MAYAQAQYLQILDEASVVYHRWQSYYGTGAITWESNPWIYVPFVADGFTQGVSNEDASISITAPATPDVITAFEEALELGRLIELRIYGFNPQDGNDTPQVGQTLVGQYLGQAAGASGNITTMTLQLGSALAPVGSQIPPRKLTLLMMGMGCRL